MSVLAAIIAARARATQKGLIVGSCVRLPSSLFALAAEEFAVINGGYIPSGSFSIASISIQDAYDGA